MAAGQLERLTAFTGNPAHGNPAGVWIGDDLPDTGEMQRIAAEVGYSETIFLAPVDVNHFRVRYFSPEAEVPFCGHATIAAGVALGRGDGPGTYSLDTLAGEVIVGVRERNDRYEASLTSVEPRFEPAPHALLQRALDCLHWSNSELDPTLPPVRAFAGAWHLVLAAATRERLANLDYDFDALKAVMLEDGLTTVQLVWRASADTFHSRNPFPVGGVVEDPATGAAAAALGGYLREADLVTAPATLTIRQGEDMGRPSLLTVTVPSSGGIIVSGTAVAISR